MLISQPDHIMLKKVVDRDVAQIGGTCAQVNDGSVWYIAPNVCQVQVFLIQYSSPAVLTLGCNTGATDNIAWASDIY